MLERYVVQNLYPLESVKHIMNKSFYIQDGKVKKVSEEYYHIRATTRCGEMIAMYVDSLDVENAVVEIGSEGTDVSGAYASYSSSLEMVRMRLEF